MSLANLTNNILTEVNTSGVVVANGTGAPTAVVGTAGQFLRRNTGNTAYEFVNGYTAAEIDAMIQGLDPKASVRVATTANITLSGTQTIDGIAVVAGDRVLVKDQGTPSQNGIYIVAAGAWSRSPDMDTASEFPGAYTFIEQGTVNADRAYVCTSDNVTVGTTAINFVLFAGSGAYVPMTRTLTINGTALDLSADRSWSVGTVTSVSGTGTVSGLTLSGTVTGSGNLTLGGTLTVTPSNFASQTANTVLAAPNGSAGVPTFRTLVAADIPTLNQNTTGSAASLTTARTINDVSFNGTQDIIVPSLFNSTYSRITNPVGGEFLDVSGSRTGAIAITLPVGMNGAMLRFKVKIYEYTTNESFEVVVGGYAYDQGAGVKTWANNPSAYIIGNPGVDRRFTVRFGYNSSLDRGVIYIGELASTWSYPQIFITDIQRGFSGQVAGWRTGWSIGFEATAFQNVTATITNSQIGYATSTNTANAVVLRDGSGNFSAGAINVAAISATSITATGDGIFGNTVGGSVITNLTINGGSSAYPNLRLTTGGTLQSQIQSFGGAMYLQANGSTTVLTLNSNLTATFSSTVSATNFIGGGTGLTSLPSNTAIYPILNQDTSGYAARLLMFDTRTIAPNSHNAGRMTFGFTSWANNNSAPYADYIHFRSYGDASGGNDNLITFHKGTIGMRIWQQSWGSASAYSTYVDVLHSNNFGNYALPLAGGTMILGANINMVANDPGNGYITFKNTSNSDRVIRFGTGRVGVDYQGLSIYDETDAATRMFMNNAGDFQFNNSVTVGGNIIGLGGSNLILAAGDVYFNNDSGYGILSQNGTRAIAITNASVTSNRITEIYRNETVNRTTYNDLFVITAAATTNPFAGHGGGIRFRGTTYRSGTGVYDWGRIGMELTDNSVYATGENMFFEVASSDSSSTLTRAMTIRYNACVGIGTTTPVSKLEVSSASQDSHFAVLGTAPGIQLSDIRTNPTQFASIGLATTTNNYVTGSAQGDLVIVNRSTVTSKAIIFGIGTTNEVGRFATSGRLLLGTTSDDTVNRLQVNGSIKATKFTESSDRRIKTPITENILVGGVENIKAHLYLKDGLQEIGYYAQDVLPYIPSAVTKGADDVYTLEYRSVFAAKIASLENRVKVLEEELNKYKN